MRDNESRSSSKHWGRSLVLVFAVVGSIFAQLDTAHAQTTVVVDGVNDFAPGECVAGGDASTWCFASDASNFYIGFGNFDVGAGGILHIVTLYIDTDPQAIPLSGSGTASGVAYNTQQPSLPMNADFQLEWRADDSFEVVRNWNGAAWVAAATGLASAESNPASFVEFSIPRGDLGAPVELNLVGSMVFEGGGFETTYAFVPATTAAVYDPDPADFLNLPLFQAISVPSMGALGGLALIGLLAWPAVRSLRSMHEAGSRYR